MWWISKESAQEPHTGHAAGYDMNPVYSADGNYIAFHSMERASFESDRNRIFTYDRKMVDL